MARKVSESTIRRLSHYLRTLEQLQDRRSETVSSEQLADEAGTTAAQVRKDLSLFGSFGKRGLGYRVDDLILHLREILGLEHAWRVALVGAGRIGSALFEYGAFRRRGFHIVTVLDRDPDKVGGRWGDVLIRDADELEAVIDEEDVEVVILAVPAESAQQMARRAVDAGVRGLLNFAPVQLRVPSGVAVQDVNMVMELEALSFELTRQDRNGDG